MREKCDAKNKKKEKEMKGWRIWTPGKGKNEIMLNGKEEGMQGTEKVGTNEKKGYRMERKYGGMR